MLQCVLKEFVAKIRAFLFVPASEFCFLPLHVDHRKCCQLNLRVASCRTERLYFHLQHNYVLWVTQIVECLVFVGTSETCKILTPISRSLGLPFVRQSGSQSLADQ